MTPQPGARVRIIKPGLLAGQEGTITSVSSPLLSVELDADETVVMLGLHEVQLLQPVQPVPPLPLSGNTVQVRLPDGVPVHVCGHAVDPVVCIVSMPARLRDFLQQHTGRPFEEAVVQRTDAPSPLPPWAAAAGMPFGGGHPGWGMPQPVPPLAAAAAPVTSATAELPTPGEASRIHLARHLVEMFLHTRNNLADAVMGPPVAPGDEWKQNAEEGTVFALTAAENRLYDTCCDVLTTFLQPLCGPSLKQSDAVDG
jgi:hypothetical protein